MVGSKHSNGGDSRDFPPNWLFDPADFSLENQLLSMNTLNSPLIKLAVSGLHPLRGGRPRVRSAYKCVFILTTLKLSWTKFNLSKEAEEVIY